MELDRPWSGFNPNTPAGAMSSTPTLLSSVLPSAYTVNSKFVPQVNADLLTSVEATSPSPLTIQYVINPKAKWSDGVPVTADDFMYAWQSQRGNGLDIDGSPDQVASTLGYDDVSSVTPSHDGETVTVRFTTPYTDWRDLFDHMVPAHIARRVGLEPRLRRLRSGRRPVGRTLHPALGVRQSGGADTEHPVVGDSGGARPRDGERRVRPGDVVRRPRLGQRDGGAADRLRHARARCGVLPPEHPEHDQAVARLPRPRVQRHDGADGPSGSAPGRRPGARPDIPAGPHLRCHGPRPGRQPGSPGRPVPAVLHPVIGGRRVRRTGSGLDGSSPPKRRLPQERRGGLRGYRWQTAHAPHDGARRRSVDQRGGDPDRGSAPRRRDHRRQHGSGRPGRAGRRRGRQLLRRGPRDPPVRPLSDRRRRAGTPMPPAVPGSSTSRTGASSTTPRSTSCSPRQPRNSTR